jgi:recombination protein RecR
LFEGPVQDLIDELGKLPGIGPKSAQRIAFHLLSVEPPDIDRLTAVLGRVRDGVQFCEVCGNVSDGERCRICADTRRDSSVVCANSGAGTTCWAARWTPCPVSGPTSYGSVSC